MKNILKPLLAVLMTLPLMGFDAYTTETDPALMPDEWMFGDRGDEPDVDSIKNMLLSSLNCELPIRQVSGYMPMVKCPYGGRDPIEADATLTVTPLNNGQKVADTRRIIRQDMTCSKRLYSKPTPDSIAFEQQCNVQGYPYKLRMQIYYGREV